MKAVLKRVRTINSHIEYQENLWVSKADSLEAWSKKSCSKILSDSNTKNRLTILSKVDWPCMPFEKHLKPEAVLLSLELTQALESIHRNKEV